MGKENNNMKAMMMRGLCHSPSATAVCSHDTLRSVIVPRPGPTNPKYSRLLQSPSPNDDRHVRSLLLSSTIARTRLPDSRGPVNSKQGNQHEFRPLSTSNVFQVVVLRVSLHCQGCAGKVKKHLSKMEGVTSFSIDLETKRVTIMGHITPNDVLESISKVKRAEFWGC